jgi:hypothetical protein
VQERGEVFYEETTLHDAAQTEAEANTLRNILAQEAYNKHEQQREKIERHNQEIANGRPSPYNWEPHLYDELPAAVNPILVPVLPLVKPNFRQDNEAYNKTHDSLIQEYESYGADCSVAINVILEHLTVNTKGEMEDIMWTATTEEDKLHELFVIEENIDQKMIELINDVHKWKNSLRKFPLRKPRTNY